MSAARDQDVRDRVRTDHRTSFVLEAGAGTGKTTLLIDRIEWLVRSGHARLDEVAAVTFTENAAAAMKLRLRERLERARVAPDLGPDERRRADAALDVLERAQVSTIHALCAALLQERPLECGVAPAFRVADEAEADLLFARAWDEWLGLRLEQGDPVVLEAVERGIPLEGFSAWGERTSLRGFARTLLEQRDLEPLVSGDSVDAEAWKQELLARCARAREAAAGVPPADALAARIQGLEAFAEQARFLAGAPLAEHLVRLPAIKERGHHTHWSSDEALAAARAVADWTRQAGPAWGAALGASLHGRLVRALAEVWALYARRKAENGVLDFLDLLVKARDALARSEAVRRYFRERFRFLIVDEFQDTDPVQVQVVDLLAGAVPGGLVVVGDAKQSIYRFRRADVDLFRQASARAREREGHAVLHLVQNFRSRPAILRFVNRVFTRLIEESVETGQPPYEAIEPPPGLPEDPAVVALRFDASFAEGEDLLRAEAAALVRFIRHAADGRVQVREPLTGELRPSRAGDVMVLTRRLTQLKHLEDALEAASLRYAVEGGKSFFDRQEVHEVLAVLRAIDDPSDRVSLVAALRSSFFGVSDRDLTAYVLAGGRLHMGPVEEDRPGAAALRPALGFLAELHKARTRLSIPALLERLYDETRVMAAFSGSRRGEARISNLEKVTALARQSAEIGVLTLRGFASLLQGRIETAREEPDLPSTRPGDPETVRVLSIHKAKGLEAPIVAVFDLADNYWLQSDVIALWAEGRVAIGFREGCQPPGWAALKNKDKAKAWAEARRLQYVACTRARDVLVIPKPSGDARVGDFWKDVVAALPSAGDADVRVVDADALPADESGEDAWTPTLVPGSDVDAVALRWEEQRHELLQEAATRDYLPIPVRELAARSAPPAVAPPGGAGRDFGRLVHRMLQWIPPDADAAQTAAMAAALAPAYGLDDAAAAQASETVRRCLALPLMDRVRRAPRVWRELPLRFPHEVHLAEGEVDLVFEEDGGLVVVDYKTDHIAEGQALDQAHHHAGQLRLYDRGLVQATGMKVRERLVLFTALGRAVPV